MASCVYLLAAVVSAVCGTSGVDVCDVVVSVCDGAPIVICTDVQQSIPTRLNGR